MAYIGKTYLKAFLQFNNLVVIAGHKMLQHSIGIVHRIERRHFRFTCTFCLSVLPLRLCLLNVGTVPEHNLTEITGGPGTHHLAPESPCINKWQHSHVINMGVSHKHIVHIGVTDGKLCILEFVNSLFHTAVYQDIKTACLQ